MKKWITGLLLCCFVFGTFGCSFNGGITSSKSRSERESSRRESSRRESSNLSSSVEEEQEWETCLTEQPRQTIQANETISYTVNAELGDKNYVWLDIETDVHLYGEFVYADTATGNVATEVFFIESEETEFRQFLDAFRPNGVGCFEKILQSITLTNKSEKSGKVHFRGMYVSERTLPKTEREIYIEKDGLKVGADLAAGGALTYLSRQYYDTPKGERQQVQEVIDKDNNVYIGVGMEKTEYKTLLSSSINLINIYDLGREIQQSYYAEIGGTEDDPNGANGYIRGYCDTGGRGYYWPYNPVQVGDCADNPSQIIDYEVTKNFIWIKIRPMNWSKGDSGKNFPNTIVGGETTKSYMENRYTLKNGILFVDNSFIDWNGFYDLENTPISTNEMPAVYVTHPLRNYVCYTGERPWVGDKIEIEKNLGWWDTFHPNYTHSEDWFAWVNNEQFGVGMYVPNMGTYMSGSLFESSSIALSVNCSSYTSPYANTLLFNKEYPTSVYTSCYSTNTNYTSPVQSWRLKEYEKRSYGYAISVNYVDAMRKQFQEIYESGILRNESVSAWVE